MRHHLNHTLAAASLCLATLLSSLLSISPTTAAHAQTALYPQHFPLSEVTLLPSPFRTAMLRNIEQLLAYDTDRLLTPYVRQAGLSSTTNPDSPYYQWETLHPAFENWAWNPSFALDGHLGGHYLSALALAYAACCGNDDDTSITTSSITTTPETITTTATTSNTTITLPQARAQLLDRLNHMVSVLADCQAAYDDNTEGLKGMICGLPDNTIWTSLHAGDPSQYAARSAWVPLYVVHKTMAALRDAYVYASNDTALTLLKGMGDWLISLADSISDDTMQNTILATEHGGINEILADLYALTQDERFLRNATRFSHQQMITGMTNLSTTFLDYMHANTQVPKYLGFERIAQVDDSASSTSSSSTSYNPASYHSAALNFWTDVTANRTVAIGGNSVDEHFLAHDDGDPYITNLNGPETCNTYNMLKLSEALFDVSHDASLADYYERAILNHVLSTQDPLTGGYVYFTPLRPQSYRIYSVVNEAQWCCVGSGMENHSRYAHFAYTRSAPHSDDSSSPLTDTLPDTLWVNLYIASMLNNESMKLTQRTSFPYGTTSTIRVENSRTFTLALRHPSWTTGEFSVCVNGKNISPLEVEEGKASYVYVTRQWEEGDSVVVNFPMSLALEPCPNNNDYVALRYGPTVLAAATTSTDPNDDNYEELTAQYAGIGRMDHAPGSMESMLSLATAPMLIGDRDTILNRVKEQDLDELTFTVDASREGGSWGTLTLAPFYTVQNTRYCLYWLQQSEEDFANSDIAQQEAEALALEERTLDMVATGEQQSEAGHNCMASSDSSTGTYNGEYYRDATASGYFQYDLSLSGATLDDNISVMFRYCTADAGRVGQIYIDGVLFETVTVINSATAVGTFYDAEYLIPESFLLDAEGNLKASLTIRMQGSSTDYAPGVYCIRLLTGYEGRAAYTFLATDWTTGDAGRIPASSFSYDEEANTLSPSATGANNICLNLTADAMEKYYITNDETYLLVCGQDLSLADKASYLWWLNGGNEGTEVAPSYAIETSDGRELIVWNIRESGIDYYTKNATNELSGNTIFGLTSASASGACTIYDVSFYTHDEVAELYPDLGFVPSGVNAPSTGETMGAPAHGKVYDLRGVRIGEGNATRGIYIIDGKKVARP